MDPKELFGKDYQEFCEVDPFNPKNTVEGYISRKANEFYGALLITRVNSSDVRHQLIMGSPKMHYPFYSREDGTRNYRFPSARNIEVFDKLDGTNILAYFYYDAIYRYCSYKTRLRPFVRSGRFGDFLSMWKEVATYYFKAIQKEMQRSDCNLSFELYGARNPHLIIYKNALDIALLFGVTNDGKILSPTDLKGSDLPMVDKLKDISKDYVWNYEQLRKDLQDRLQEEEEGHYSGLEGAVWYLHTIKGRCIQLKCKPETIEAIHFSAGAGGLARNVIITTCWNAFENVDTLTTTFIKQLLLEEFKPEVIEEKHSLIEKCISFVTKEAEFRQEVLSAYKATGKNILLDKVSIMRELSSKFPRDRMRKVYDLIANQ